VRMKAVSCPLLSMVRHGIRDGGCNQASMLEPSEGVAYDDDFLEAGA
jgi:hypothetical protein